ncbi:MAG: YraN family protein [Candidatus Caldarchaeum sp.]
MPKGAPPGLYYEVLVSNWLQYDGYKTRIRQRSKKIGEADIIATKSRLFNKEVIFVECKDKSQVSLTDFHKFVSKFRRFLNNNGKAEGLLVYSGDLHPDVKDYWQNTLESDLRNRIQLIRKTRDKLRRYTKM